MSNRCLGIYRRYTKRLLDIVLSIFAFPVLAIVFIIVAPIIVSEDKGPVFYNAPRLGKNGKVFIMYKFRSMKANAPDLRNKDGTTYNAEDDPRVTKIGKILRKTSLDETPQLINVIKGDMSLIGPRPDLTGGEMTSMRKKKLTVRPGITGYSQAFFRNSDSVEQRNKNDIYYVNNISLGLDVLIFLKTIQTVLFHQNVYRNGGGNK